MEQSSSHIYFCRCIIYLNVYLWQAGWAQFFLQWPAASYFKVTPGDWPAHPHISKQSWDSAYTLRLLCYCQHQFYTKHAWTHLTKSILLLMAAQWRSVTFSLSGCRTSKPASTNSLQRSKMPYLGMSDGEVLKSPHTQTQINTGLNT